MKKAQENALFVVVSYRIRWAGIRAVFSEKGPKAGYPVARAIRALT